jgi:hypothetical protein
MVLKIMRFTGKLLSERELKELRSCPSALEICLGEIGKKLLHFDFHGEIGCNLFILFFIRAVYNFFRSNILTMYSLSYLHILRNQPNLN